MPAPRGALGITVCTPVLTGDDSCPAEVAHAMEQALLGVQPTWTVSRVNQLVILLRGDAWIAKARVDGGLPLSPTTMRIIQ
ncbi:MAG: hypothetical protein EOP84_09185 [Verrucomicrobiaceae bacterium]|nr:MAG: hypothetical protein EOP84_09185 [Verrucomicrobiaceae bacterium]